jgi:hypothetical protein
MDLPGVLDPPSKLKPLGFQQVEVIGGEPVMARGAIELEDSNRFSV